MGNPDDLIVFFNNDRKAAFPGGQVAFHKAAVGGDRDLDQAIRRDTAAGCAVVNWDNVCFVARRGEDSEHEDLGG